MVNTVPQVTEILKKVNKTEVKKTVSLLSLILNVIYHSTADIS